MSNEPDPEQTALDTQRALLDAINLNPDEPETSTPHAEPDRGWGHFSRCVSDTRPREAVTLRDLAGWFGGGKLRPGEQALYTLPDGPRAGEQRPGVVVRVVDARTGRVNLQVFTDGLDDGDRYAAGIVLIENVQYHHNHKPGTWIRDR